MNETENNEMRIQSMPPSTGVWLFRDTTFHIDLPIWRISVFVFKDVGHKDVTLVRVGRGHVFFRIDPLEGTYLSPGITDYPTGGSRVGHLSKIKWK